MDNQEILEHVKRAKIAERYILAVLLSICVGGFFAIRWMIREDVYDDDTPLEYRGMAVAVVYKSVEIATEEDEIEGYKGIGVFYVDDKRYFCNLETLRVAPFIGLRFQVYYDRRNPKANKLATTAVMDTILRSPEYGWYQQSEGKMELSDTVRRIDKGIYDGEFDIYEQVAK